MKKTVVSDSDIEINEAFLGAFGGQRAVFAFDCCFMTMKREAGSGTNLSFVDSARAQASQRLPE